MSTTTVPLGLLLRRLDRLIDERFVATLGARGISRRQWQLLNALPGDDAALGAAVAEFLGPGETVREHLEPLAERGYIREGYSLTQAGQALVEELAREVAATRALTVAHLADGEYERTVRTLELMIGNLSDNRDSARAPGSA